MNEGAGISIRQAVAADESAVRAIAVAAYTPRAARLSVPPSPLTDDYVAPIAAGRAWMADRGAALVGYVIVHADARLWIDHIAVALTAQGPGIGQQWLQHAETLATRQRHAAVHLYTPALIEENRRWYACQGYIETARRTEAGRDRVYFEKHLR